MVLVRLCIDECGTNALVWLPEAAGILVNKMLCVSYSRRPLCSYERRALEVSSEIIIIISGVWHSHIFRCKKTRIKFESIESSTE